MPPRKYQPFSRFLPPASSSNYLKMRRGFNGLVGRHCIKHEFYCSNSNPCNSHKSFTPPQPSPRVRGGSKKFINDLRFVYYNHYCFFWQVILLCFNGVVAFICGFLPYVGEFLSVILVGLPLLDSHWKAGEVLLLYFLIKQITAGNFVTPILMKKQGYLLSNYTLAL